MKDALPSAYSITDADVAGLLPTGKTLSGEISDGNIYMVNCELLKDIKCGKNPNTGKRYFCTSPLLVMHLKDGSLHPLAIQQWAGRPPSENPVWTPNDSPNEWLHAKIIFNNASGNVCSI